jgi:hypothetical protein
MADNRWDLGVPQPGAGLHEGAITPLNAGTLNFSDYATIFTPPYFEPPGTMAGQMEGDEDIGWGGSGGGRRRRRG